MLHILKEQLCNFRVVTLGNNVTKVLGFNYFKSNMDSFVGLGNGLR